MKVKFKELYEIMKGQKYYDAQKERVFDLTLLIVKKVKLAKAEIADQEEARDKVEK